MKSVEIDGLSIDYITKELKEQDSIDISEKDLLKALKEILADCDRKLLDLIIENM